jgi:hypothetical protein
LGLIMKLFLCWWLIVVEVIVGAEEAQGTDWFSDCLGEMGHMTCRKGRQTKDEQ